MSQTEPAQLPGPLTILVEFEIRADSCTTEEWLDVWRQRAQDAQDHEPETSAYAAALATEDTARVLIFERYENGQTSLDAHMQRDAHAQLLQAMGARNMTKRRVMSQFLADIEGYGWWERPDQPALASCSGLLMTVFGTRFRSTAMREEYLALTREHADYCRDAEPGTLIYSAGVAQRDGDRGPDVGAGDLLFVAAFADAAAVAAHRDDARHLALQRKLETIERERTFLQTYNTSGCGFLWR